MMEKFTTYTGGVVPLDRDHVDTDAIIPKQFLKSIKRTGFGVNAFDEWRYLDRGEPDQPDQVRTINPDFILNQPVYQKATILLARHNFGCGSSREHAVWALQQYGFRAILADSFADIFYNNSLKNGLLPIQLQPAEIEHLFGLTRLLQSYELTIDLVAQRVRLVEGVEYTFDISPFHRNRLLNGFDDIGITLQHAEKIKHFEAQQKSAQPWLG